MSFSDFFNNFQEINESSLSRVTAHVHNKNIGLITAHRGEHTSQENANRNKNLEHDLKKHGLGFIKVKGKYIENKGQPHEKHVAEHSYLVVGKEGHDHGHLEGALKHLGAKYHQDAVVTKKPHEEHAELHATKEGTWMGAMGSKQSIGKFHVNRTPEIHSALTGRRTFSFEESVQSTETDMIGFGFYTYSNTFSGHKETEF